MKKYAHIIAGCGAAGLSLAYHLSNVGFPGGTVLMIDRDDKETNDHTWGYWSRSPQPFDSIAKLTYQKVALNVPGKQIVFDLNRYTYRIIESDTLYAFIKNHLAQFKEVEWLKADIKQFREEDNEGIVETSEGSFKADYIFSSLYEEKEIKERSRMFIKQHFNGWTIETASEVFNPEVATLFDFTIPQQNQLRFIQILPESTTKAFVEFNIFSGKPLEMEEHEKMLKEYIEKTLKISIYKITAKEWNAIPITDHYFATRKGDRIINIGIAGGAVKASSGYTFKRIQRHTMQLAQLLKDQWPPYIDANSGPRFRFYDQILLNIMMRDGGAGVKIFSELFSKNGPEKIFKFLDEDTMLNEELKIISSIPSFPFLRSMVTLAGKEVNPISMMKTVINKEDL
jgi:lycopene beta-cyclase